MEDLSTEWTLMNLHDAGLLLHVFSYLPCDDLNSLAICSVRLHTLRSSTSLDQTRTGTWNFRCPHTFGDALTRLVHATTCTRRCCRSIFQGNRTKLRLVGFVENLTEDALQVSSVHCPVVLFHVTSLDLSCEKRPDDLQTLEITRRYLKVLGHVLPNVTTLDISNSHEIVALLSRIKSAFPKLQCLIANDTTVKILLERWTLRQWKTLRELYVQGQQGVDVTDLCHGLPPNLVKLDLWNVRDANLNPVPVKELHNILVGMPNLQWLRCELSNPDHWRLNRDHPNVKIINF